MIDQFLNSMSGYDWAVGLIICIIALQVFLENVPNHWPGATALRVPKFYNIGSPIGCHYLHGNRHMENYPKGATHLCNSYCVHEPPPER